MINKNYLKLLRSKVIDEKNNFIYKKVSERIVDSLDLTKINFNRILQLGINDYDVYHYLLNKFPKSKFTQADLYFRDNIGSSPNLNKIKIDFDKIDFKNNHFDLIFSNFILHLSNNVENSLIEIHKSMRPNAFFIASIPHFENCYQLVNSMYKTDLEIYSGVHSRVNPTIQIEKIISILKKINFDIPTVNTDSFIIEYSNFKKLLRDLKSTRLSYSYDDKRSNFENKRYFKTLEKIYKNNYFNGNYLLEVKFNIISAWKK